MFLLKNPEIILLTEDFKQSAVFYLRFLKPVL